jgi:hypothetical protein
MRLGFSQKRVLPEPEPPIIITFLFRAYFGLDGRLFIVRLSVCVKMILLSGFGSMYGLMSSDLPHLAEPYSISLRNFLAFFFFKYTTAYIINPAAKTFGVHKEEIK